MTRAYGYIRISGKAQIEGDGPERQRDAILAFAKANDIEIVEFFQEQVTGKAEGEDREAWTMLLDKLNGVRTIVVEKLDRLARSLIVQEKILLDLESREVTLKTTDGQDTDDQDPARVMFRQFLGSIAQYERACIVAKLKTARDRKRRDTGRCEGAKPFGRNEQERLAMENMRQLRDAGHTFDQIALRLNNMDVPTRHGKTWYGKTVANILHARGREES